MITIVSYLLSRYKNWRAIKVARHEEEDKVPRHVMRAMERTIKKYKADLDYLKDR